MRRDFDPGEMSSVAFYKLLNSVVVPRPIAWVSSVSAQGVDNLAPHSFFTVSSSDPAVVQFTSVGDKDTLANVQHSREFVVSLAPEWLFEQVNATGTDFPRDVSEFDAVGVEREPSLLVGAPRVAASPVALECVLHATVGLGSSTVVFGRVVHAAVSEDVLDGDHPEIDKLRPLSRLGRNQWGSAGQIRAIDRIRYADWPGHYDHDEGQP